MSTTTSTSTLNMVQSRVVIVGAGWHGLAAAKTYLELHPNVTLHIIDEDSSIGGVWSSLRIYPGLIADSCAAVFDYSDFPMHEAIDVDEWADLPGEKVHEYLERYVDKFDLRKRCRLNTKVVHVERMEGEKADGTWKVEIDIQKEFETYTVRDTIICDKLILATGVTSTPNIPQNLNYDAYAGPVMHSREVGAKHSLLVADRIKRVTVVGGSKSAVDVVYLCALAGKEVDWVIREDGYGPILLFDPRFHGIHAAAIKNMRVTNIVGPNILWPGGFWYRLLHDPRATFGPKIINWLLKKSSKFSINGFYGKNENTMKIAPDMKDLLWSNSGVSVVHHKKFMELVADGKLIHVHRAAVSSFSLTSVKLSTALTLPSDATIFATGWTTNQSSIFSSSILETLGLPAALPSQAPYWESLEYAALERIRQLFPRLANPPKSVQEYDAKRQSQSTTTPFRLYRGLVSPDLTSQDDRSFLVLGTMINTAIPTYAELSALWGVAYLESHPFAASAAKTLLDVERMRESIATMNAWGWVRNRCRTFMYLDGSQEIQLFMDQIVEDLGLHSQRKRMKGKGLGWAREWFEPYRGGDYKGVVQEYIKRWNLDESNSP